VLNFEEECWLLVRYLKDAPWRRLLVLARLGFVFSDYLKFVLFTSQNPGQMCRDEDSSPWTRTRVPILLDSDSSPSHLDSDSRHADSTRTRTVGTRPDLANCTDRASLTELSRGLLCNIIMLFMVLWKMPRARARQFFSSGLGFGLETQKPGLGLETCWTLTCLRMNAEVWMFYKH